MARRLHSCRFVPTDGASPKTNMGFARYLLMAAVALVLAPSSSAGGDLPRLETVRVGDAVFRIEFQPEDARAAREVAQALETAVSKAQRWGSLVAPVTIALHPTHGALEAAVRREGYAWLRAWAAYDRIDLQSPRTWSACAGRDQVAELLAHEVTHCVMYQLAGTESSWAHKGIPLWFREGMATETAERGHRHVGPEALWRYYAGASQRRSDDEASPGGSGGPGGAAEGNNAGARHGGDPLSNPGPLYRTESAVVYDTAHLAFRFLVKRYGDDRVRAVLAAMGQGRLFGPAFQSAVGISAEAFEADFRRYILWRGWARR